MLTFLSFIYGASLGSFANLIADRLRVRSIFKGRSMCLHCGKKLTWRELFPIISYISQKGKCAGCKSNISQMYFWSEIFVGILIAFLPVVIVQYIDVFASPASLYYAIFLFFILSISIALCAAIVIYDLRHMIVPFETAMILLGIGMLATVVRQYFYGFNIYDFFAGAIVATPFTLMYAFSKGKWVGMGDVMMYGALGFILGLPIGVTTFFYSVWLGAFVSLVLLVVHKRDYNLKSEIPFTPFIIIGALLAFYTHSDILSLYDILY